jgi:hypothetical protein
MTTKQKAPPPTPAGRDGVGKLIKQYGCGPFAGVANILACSE